MLKLWLFGGSGNWKWFQVKETQTTCFGLRPHLLHPHRRQLFRRITHLVERILVLHKFATQMFDESEKKYMSVTG